MPDLKKTQRREVLNALRHQRLGNHSDTDFDRHFHLCSTPCGINGWETRSSSRSRRSWESVLNALRHQRLGNAYGYLDPTRDRACSTPCGINGWETMSGHSSTFLPASAQRLAASTVGKHVRSRAEHHPTTVLNALRHQRLGNLQLNSPLGSWNSSAQRLAASTVGKQYGCA